MSCLCSASIRGSMSTTDSASYTNRGCCVILTYNGVSILLQPKTNTRDVVPDAFRQDWRRCNTKVVFVVLRGAHTSTLLVRDQFTSRAASNIFNFSTSRSLIRCYRQHCPKKMLFCGSGTES